MKDKEEIKVKPFLKWAGGKKILVYQLLKFIPKKYSNYFEPFLGSGALFFVLRPKRACLFDLNEELINTYKQIKKNVGKVIKILENMKYNKGFYYKIRAKKTNNNLFRAARFIYLNKTCWNGLYRVNSNGRFNVPIGKYCNPTICDDKNLRAVSEVLKNVNIKTADFEDAIQGASKDDLVYFDPPYTTSHKDNGFIEYNSKIFSLDDQVRLKKIAMELDKKGCKIIISNADHSYISSLYSCFNINVVKRKSLIAGNKKKRKYVSELIITNF